MVVLTKGDLMDSTVLAQCVLAVQLDLAAYVPDGKGKGKSKSAQHEEVIVNDTAAARVEAAATGVRTAIQSNISSENSSNNSANTSSDAESNAEDSSDSDADSNGDEDTEDTEDIEDHSNEAPELHEEEQTQYVRENVNIPNREKVPVQVISAATGAGVQQLWRRLCEYARADAPIPRSMLAAPPSAVVREHRLAAAVRAKRVFQRVSRPPVETSSTVRRSPENNRRKSRPPPVKIGKNRRSVRARARAAATTDTKL